MLILFFDSLLRLRQELAKLITSHTDKLSDPVAKASAQSIFYEQLLQGLSVGVMAVVRRCSVLT